MPQSPSKKHKSTTSAVVNRVKRGGRKAVVIDREKLEQFIEAGCKTSELAAIFGCAEATIVKRFSVLLRTKRESVKAELRAKQLELARAGDRTMLIWLGKNLIGQTDRQDVTTAGEALKVVVERIG